MNRPQCSIGLSLDTPIYRIHRQGFLEELLDGTLRLPATRHWHDPWENLICWCGYDILGDDGKVKQTFFGNNRFPTFGQCWSTCPESDAMWRIYSAVDEERGVDSFFSEKEGVRLRTTARKLVNALAKGMDNGNEQECFIGAVNYIDEAQLQNFVVNAVAAYRDKAFGGSRGHADALLFKRSPFSHEREVRLLYIDSGRRFEKQDFVEVPIDVNTVIDEITLDPRLRAGGGGEQKRLDWLRSKGFKNAANVSSLYQRILIEIPLWKP